MPIKSPFTASHQDHKICKIALLIALACVLQIAESMIPHPVPGLRLGLANMLTLTAMVVLGFRYALEVAVLRSVLSALIMGTFMSPTFILSLSGALVSTLVMGLFYWLSGLGGGSRMSIIGISIIGAFVHNLVQLYLAYLLLVKHAGVFVFFPWLSIGAVATGWVVGVVAGGVCQRLQACVPEAGSESLAPHGEALPMRMYSPGDTWIHRLPAVAKFVALVILAIMLLIVSHVWAYIIGFVVVSGVMVASKTPFGFLTALVRRYLMLIVIPFFLPLFFSSATDVLIRVCGIAVTLTGLHRGALLSSRILLLIAASALVMRTTSMDQLLNGLERLLWPLKLVGVDPHRIASLLSMAWTAAPYVWKTTHDAVTAADMRNIETLRGLLPMLSSLIAGLYLKTQPSAGFWNSSSRTVENDPNRAC